MIECVANISEGKRSSVVERIADAVARTGCCVLDVHSDPDHHRSVLTFAGEQNAIEDGAMELARSSIALLDLREHCGVHPRIGVVDVVPFVPLSGSNMQECVEVAHRVGRSISSALNVPIFLYANAAQMPERATLAAIRRGGFEGLRERLIDPEWRPDFGPAAPHPTAGAVAVGARDFLVAFNILLDCDDVAIAKAIALRVRASCGGLPGVQALGFELESQGLVQVSMNVTDIQATSLQSVFDRVAQEAAIRGVGVLESEFVGLVPERALRGATAQSLAYPRDLDSVVLERRLQTECS